MRSLKKILSDSSKHRRGRRNLLGIQITVTGWFVEVIAFFTFAIGAYVFGHRNSILTLSLQTLTMTFYSIVLPCTILINGNDVKTTIIDLQWYFSFINFFGCQPSINTGNEDVPAAEESGEGNEQGIDQDDNRNRIQIFPSKIAWETDSAIKNENSI